MKKTFTEDYLRISLETGTVFYSVTKLHMCAMLTLTGKRKVIPESLHINVSRFFSFQYCAAPPTESEAYLKPSGTSTMKLFCERRSGVFIVNFEHFSLLRLVILLLTLSR